MGWLGIHPYDDGLGYGFVALPDRLYIDRFQSIPGVEYTRVLHHEAEYEIGGEVLLVRPMNTGYVYMA